MRPSVPKGIAVALALAFASLEPAIVASENENATVKSSAQATVFLYRVDRIGTKVLPLILVNETGVGIFATRRYIKIRVDPGNIIIGLGANLPNPPFTYDNLEAYFREPRAVFQTVRFIAESDKEYFVRGEGNILEFSMMEVDPSEGAIEMKGLKEMKCSFVVLRELYEKLEASRDTTIHVLNILAGGRKVVCEDQ